MLFTCINFMFSDFTWKKNLLQKMLGERGGGAAATNYHFDQKFPANGQTAGIYRRLLYSVYSKKLVTFWGFFNYGFFHGSYSQK